MSAVDHTSDHDDVAVRSAGSHELELHEVEHEKPEDWGWHADLGKQARFAGWLCVVVLAIGLTCTHYNHAGTAAIGITMGILIIGLLVDRHMRKTTWRS